MNVNELDTKKTGLLFFDRAQRLLSRSAGGRPRNA